MLREKIELLHRAGAQVWVVAQTLSSELEQQYQDGRIHWLAQDFLPEQLDNVFLVIAATNDTVLNAAVFAAADQRCILANVVDDQPLCSFIFPSIVDRSPLVVAISSSGQAPVLARILREKLEALLPTRLSDMAAIAGRWRGRVKQHMASMGERRRFWEHAFSGRFASLISRGQLTEAENELQLSLEGQHRALGEVALVGAGPGDAGLLTLRGLQVMQQADVVLYDHLVSPEVLDLVRRDAERICVGKRAGAHSVTQEATNQLLVTLAQQGKRVVRLKGGDPFIFGRGGKSYKLWRKRGSRFRWYRG